MHFVQHMQKKIVPFNKNKPNRGYSCITNIFEIKKKNIQMHRNPNDGLFISIFFKLSILQILLLNKKSLKMSFKDPHKAISYIVKIYN